MNTFLMAGSSVVTLALIFYSIGIITEQRKKTISTFALTFVALGLLFDITGTLLMIVGAHFKLLTWHGLIGYTALGGMLVDTILLWKGRAGKTPSKKVHIYTRIAYIWWVIAYLSGVAIAMAH
jgi:hypothetical protein